MPTNAILYWEAKRRVELLDRFQEAIADYLGRGRSLRVQADKRPDARTAAALAAFVVVLTAQAAAAQGPAGRPPVLTVAVRCGAELRSPAAGPIRVSNIGLIGLKIGMHYFEVPPILKSPGPLDLILANLLHS